jgi:hypothetical protein
VIAVLIVALGGSALSARIVSLARLMPDEVDLPCPWCRAATAENDEACPNCGARFEPR